MNNPKFPILHTSLRALRAHHKQFCTVTLQSEFSKRFPDLSCELFCESIVRQKESRRWEPAYLSHLLYSLLTCLSDQTSGFLDESEGSSGRMKFSAKFSSKVRLLVHHRNLKTRFPCMRLSLSLYSVFYIDNTYLQTIKHFFHKTCFVLYMYCIKYCILY